MVFRYSEQIHCYERRSRERMCSQHVYLALLMFFLTSVMVEPASEGVTPNPEMTKRCLELNKITEIIEKDRTTSYLSNVLKSCEEADREKLTWVASAIYEISKTVQPLGYETIKKLIKSEAVLKKIDECVKKETSKNFSATQAQKEFGFVDTKALAFDYDRCEKSTQLRACIQGTLYDNGTLTADTKAQKDILENAFAVTSEMCELINIREDRSSGQNLYSSIAVTLSSAMMMIKLLLSDF